MRSVPPVKHASYLSAVYILQFVEHSRSPIIYCRDSNYLGAEIVHGGLCQTHLLFADAHVLSDAKLCCSNWNALSLDVHPKPYDENVSIGYSRRHYVYGRVSLVIVRLDKFSWKVSKSLVVLTSKIFVKHNADRPMTTFHERTFLVGILAHIKLDALAE